MEYFGILQTKESTLSSITKWAVAAAAVYMAILGVQQKYWVFIIFALIVIGVAFHRKKQVINQHGVDVMDIFIIYKHHRRWRWRDVVRMHADCVAQAPNAVVLIASVNGKQRQFIMTPEDALASLELAKEMNPAIRATIRKNTAKASKGGRKIPAEELASYTRPAPDKANIRMSNRRLKRFYRN